MFVCRNKKLINLDNVSMIDCTEAKNIEKQTRFYIRFLFSFCDVDGSQESETFRFKDEKDRDDAFGELMTQIKETISPLFYMDDIDLWPERC